MDSKDVFAGVPQPATSPRGFTQFDWKRGFRTVPHSPPKARASCVGRSLRVSLFEAAFGCTRSVVGGREGAWSVDVTIHPGTLHGALVQDSDIRVRSGAEELPHSFRLTIGIEKHPLFKLDQNRLSIAVPLSVWRWALGGEITVPTLEGSARVALPGMPTVLLVKNQGWPEYQKPRQRKPLFVLPKVLYPQQLRPEERRMLELLEVRNQIPELQCWSRHLQGWLDATASGG